MAQAAFGGYTALTTTTTAQNKTDIVANLNKLSALFQAEGSTTRAAIPDFDFMTPEGSQQIRNEIAALIAVINASP